MEDISRMWQKNTHGRKGEAQGVLSYQQVKGIFDNPHVMIFIWSSPKSASIHTANPWDLQGHKAA